MPNSLHYLLFKLLGSSYLVKCVFDLILISLRSASLFHLNPFQSVAAGTFYILIVMSECCDFDPCSCYCLLLAMLV